MKSILIIFRAITLISSVLCLILSLYFAGDHFYHKLFAVKAHGIITSVQLRTVQAPADSQAERPPHYQIDYQDLNKQEVRGVLVGVPGQSVYQSGDQVEFTYLKKNTQKLRQIDLENPWPQAGLYFLISMVLLALSIKPGFRKQVTY